MIEMSPEVQRHVNALFDACHRLDRGCMISHVEIERITGLRHGAHPYYYIIDRLKHRLLDDRGIVLRGIAGVGYRLLLASEVVREHADWRLKRGARQLFWAARDCDATPDGLLTENDRQLKHAKVNVARRERNRLQADLRLARLMGLEVEAIPA
jgi:hypothetical protein